MKIFTKVIFSTIIISLLLISCEKGYQPPSCNYNIHFPDTVFKNTLLDMLIEEGEDYRRLDENRDGEICDGEASRVIELYISDSNIRDIEGLEHFVNLRNLDCRGCNIESISFSSNSLKKLTCINNLLTDLDVSKMGNLIELWCNNNKLTKLDLSKNTGLKHLSCDSNLITSLDVSNNLNLEWLTFGNNDISSISVDDLAKLEYLRFNDNQISSIDISKNTNLRSINFNGNPIYEIDLSNNLALSEVWFGDNPMTVLDISENHNVIFLRNDGEFPFEIICVWTLPFPPSGTYINTVNFPYSYEIFEICD